MTDLTSATAQRIDAIQLLRAIAALAVVTQHIPIGIFGDGFWGVDLFFVISGFVMCYVTARTTAHFFLKRLIRIVPLYWAGTLGIFAIAVLLPQLVNTTTSSLSDLVKSLFFIPFKKGDLVVPIVFQGWTLNLEMLFYLLFAVSIRVSHRYRAVVCAVLLIAIVVAGKLIPSASLVWSFYSQSILLEFVLGMACFAVFERTARQRQSQTPRQALTWTALGLSCLVVLPFASDLIPSDERVVKWGLLSAIAFACLVHGLASIPLPRQALLVGDASYSLYLFHPYVIQLMNKTLGLAAVDTSSLEAYGWAFLVIFVCVGASICIYVGFERPSGIFLRKLLRADPTAQPKASGALA